MARSELSLLTYRAFVVPWRTPPPGTSAAYDARGEHPVSGQVAHCRPCGIPRSSPQRGAVWCKEAVSHAGFEGHLTEGGTR
jgi:hypothetical protein